MLFVCGSSGNRDRFLPYFTKVFNLRIDDETMRRRLQERTNNDFGKEPEELELMLRLNRSDEKPAGAIDIDATQPLDQVVDEVLRLANCRTDASDSAPVPWSKRGTAIGQSFVIPESALPSGAVERRTSSGMSSAARPSLASSTPGPATFSRRCCAYLDEQGIDLDAL